MSTSQPGFDGTSQEAANRRIKELERQLFVADGKAQEIKQDLETQLQRTRRDLETQLQKMRQDLETENRNLRGESIERKLAASYDMQQAIRESDTLKEELASLRALFAAKEEERATLRTLLAAKEEEHPKENTASKNRPNTSESPLGNASLQAEITRLKETVDKLTQTKKLMQEHVLEVQGLAEKYEKRIDNDINRLKTYKEYTNSLEKDVAFYREAFQKLHTEQQAAEEAKSAINADAQRLAEDAQHAQEESTMKFDTEMENLHTAISSLQSRFSSAQKVLDLGLPTVFAAQAKSDEKGVEMESHLSRWYNRSVALAVKGRQHQPTMILPRLDKKSKVAPTSENIGGTRIKGKKVETHSAPQIPEDGNMENREGKASTIAEIAIVNVAAPSTPKISLDDETKEKRDDTLSTSKSSHEDRTKENRQISIASPAGPTHDGKETKQAEVLLSPKHDDLEAGRDSKEQSDKKGTSKEKDVQKSIASCGTSGSNCEKQTALPEQEAHQGSERILKLESEIEEAGLRYQDLEGLFEGLEQRYHELQRIHTNVAEENAVLNKKIGGTLEAFIPKAEKMLHKGMKMDKNTRDLLNSLIKIVRDGLREG